MKVELNLEHNCKNPYARIVTGNLTSTLQSAISILEKEGEGGSDILTGQKDGKIYIVNPVQVEIIRTEGRELVLYDRAKTRYILGKPLYELEKILGQDFVRISKSALLNIRRIHHVEASFNGTMGIVMKNGVEEVITRSYRKQFKERLGV